MEKKMIFTYDTETGNIKFENEGGFRTHEVVGILQIHIQSIHSKQLKHEAKRKRNLTQPKQHDRK